MAVLVKDVPKGKIQLLILLQSSLKAISDNLSTWSEYLADQLSGV